MLLLRLIQEAGQRAMRAFNLSTEKAEGEGTVFEAEASLVYVASSSTARTTWRDPVSENPFSLSPPKNKNPMGLGDSSAHKILVIQA